MKLQLIDVLALASSLRALDGRDKVVRVNNEDRVVREPFVLGADTRLAGMVNLSRLRPLIEAYDQLRRDAIMKLSEDGVIHAGTPKAVEFADEDRRMLMATQEVKLHKIEIAELKLDQNALAPAVLEGLAPILKFAPPPNEEE